METGSRIKRVAAALYRFVLVFCIIEGLGVAIICAAVSDGEPVPIFLGILGGAAWITNGVFFAWVIKTLIMGYAELVENSEAIRKNTEPKAMPQSAGISPNASAAKKYMAARQAAAAEKRSDSPESGAEEKPQKASAAKKYMEARQAAAAEKNNTTGSEQ